MIGDYAAVTIIGFVGDRLYVLIIARIAVSWIGLSPWHPVVRWLRIIVDPILAPFRQHPPELQRHRLLADPRDRRHLLRRAASCRRSCSGGERRPDVRRSSRSSSNSWSTSRSRLRCSSSSACCWPVSRRPLASARPDGAHHDRTRSSLRSPVCAAGTAPRASTIPAIAALILYVVLIFVIRLLFGFLLNAV